MIADTNNKKIIHEMIKEGKSIDNSLSIGMQIATIRNAIGMTGKELGDIIGTTNSYITRIETSDIERISFKVVNDIIKAYVKIISRLNSKQRRGILNSLSMHIEDKGYGVECINDYNNSIIRYVVNSFSNLNRVKSNSTSIEDAIDLIEEVKENLYRVLEEV